jgi:putative NIF3 family GTP cyclohydrolase 1 type 2
MNVKQIFKIALDEGVKSDLRGAAKVKKHLQRIKDQYKKLTPDQQAKFDQDKLINPYLDSQILYNNGKQVKKIMAGIDIDTSELLVAKKIGDIDLVFSHHPDGKAFANLSDVMPMQVEVLEKYGVPINVAQGCLRMRVEEVARGVSPINHFKTVDAAKNLDINYMCVHTMCDNLVASFLEKEIGKKKFEYVGEIMEFFSNIPEYVEAIKRGFGPKLFAGSEENFCGKIALTEITGGTSGSSKIYEKLSQAGVGTIIGMHMSEENKKEAEKNHINVIIAGHISSDSLGVNLFLDILEKKGIKIVPCSGLIRVKRFK